jgi:hypothetical protein
MRDKEGSRMTDRGTTFTVDERRCLEKLEEWVDEIRSLMEFIGPATTVAYDKEERGSLTWVEEARGRLETLKRELRAEAKQLSLRQQRGELNVAESRYYAPEIQKAAAFLTLDVGSEHGEQWRQQLGYALTTIGYPLFQLKERRDASEK